MPIPLTSTRPLTRSRFSVFGADRRLGDEASSDATDLQYIFRGSSSSNHSASSHSNSKSRYYMIQNGARSTVPGAQNNQITISIHARDRLRVGSTAGRPTRLIELGIRESGGRQPNLRVGHIEHVVEALQEREAVCSDGVSAA